MHARDATSTSEYHHVVPAFCAPTPTKSGGATTQPDGSDRDARGQDTRGHAPPRMRRRSAPARSRGGLTQSSSTWPSGFRSERTTMMSRYGLWWSRRQDAARAKDWTFVADSDLAFEWSRRLWLPISRSPRLFPVMVRMQRKRRNVPASPAVAIVIDGFPRSANTFSSRAFVFANPDVVVSHHMHAPANILLAVRHRIPTSSSIRSAGRRGAVGGHPRAPQAPAARRSSSGTPSTGSCGRCSTRSWSPTSRP